MKLFDFHCHPILKQLFSDAPNIDSLIYRDDITFVPKVLSDLANVIDSQIHQSQLAQFNDEVVVGAVLYSPEKYVARAVIPLISYLKAGSRYKLSQKLLEDIESNAYTYFSDFLMNRTLNKYLEATASFHILRKESFKNPLQKDKVNVFFTIEGCHSLVDQPNYCDEHNRYNPQEILQNLDKVLEKVPVVSVNLTHLQQSNLCNHAFGMQIAGVADFIPGGNGLEDDGRAVVQGLYDRNICADVKHMSYKSRRDLMAESDAGRFENMQPVVCTHAGFTGVPFKEWAGHIQYKKPSAGAVYVETTKPFNRKSNPRRPGFPAFNLSTINLFDEEIAWIVKNGGVIGISVDRRILGFVDKFDEKPTGEKGGSRIVDKEYLSRTEWDALKISNGDIGKLIDDDECMTLKELEDSTERSIPQRDEFFYDHFLHHIKHYFQVCKNYGIDLKQAQKQLTIGTDFDGLINPFFNYSNVREMTNLKSYVRLNLRFFLEDLRDSKKWVKEINLDAFVEDLFYRNGVNFLKSRLK